MVNFSDHPRACGEHARGPALKSGPAGSSPRMRGTLSAWLRVGEGKRIIPAHAGNTPPRRPVTPSTPDHPRACGEHAAVSRTLTHTVGSSPRMRGTHLIPIHVFQRPRIIPAHAGNTEGTRPHYSPASDHPRACGEHQPQPAIERGADGSSPRMRGTLSRLVYDKGRSRIIPAHAGNT